MPFGKVHYIDEGSGPCLILLHGIGASIYTWRYLIPLLSKKYRVIALDLPGFGLSDKRTDLKYDLDAQTERVIEVTRRLKIKTFSIIGSSMGGLIGLWLALRFPQNVGKVLGLSPALSPALFPFNPAPLQVLSNWSARNLNEAWIRRILSRVIVSYADVETEDLQAYLRPYQQQPDAVRVFLMALATVRDPRIPHHLSDLQKPVLLLHGELDKIIPLKVSTQALSELPTARLEVLKNAGHHLHEDNPEWVFERADEFFRS